MGVDIVRFSIILFGYNVFLSGFDIVHFSILYGYNAFLEWVDILRFRIYMDIMGLCE